MLARRIHLSAVVLGFLTFTANATAQSAQSLQPLGTNSGMNSVNRASERFGVNAMPPSESAPVKPMGYGISSRGLRHMSKQPLMPKATGASGAYDNQGNPNMDDSTDVQNNKPFAQPSAQMSPDPTANQTQTVSPVVFASGRSVDGSALVAMDPSGIFYVQNLTSVPLLCQATGYRAAHAVIAPIGTIHKAFILQSQYAERPFDALPLTKLHVECQKDPSMQPSWSRNQAASHWD